MLFFALRFLRPVSILLFLNKIDILAEKIAKGRSIKDLLAQHPGVFPDYDSCTVSSKLLGMGEERGGGVKNGEEQERRKGGRAGGEEGEGNGQKEYILIIDFKRRVLKIEN